MAAPNTYLLGQPSKDDDPFGTPISSNDLLKGLNEINPEIKSWEQHSPGLWWPGKARGVSTIWLGDPGGTSRKITAFNYGAIPEFTQMGPQGEVIAKGWRAIFEKVIRCGAAKRHHIEAKFRVDLQLGDKDTVYCSRCRRDGVLVKTDGGSRGLCYSHDLVMKNVVKYQEARQRRREQLRRIA